MRLVPLKTFVYFFLVFNLGSISDISAGGMYDVLGDFETETEELSKDTVVKVGNREVVLRAGTGASYYVQNCVRTGLLYMGRLAEDAVLSAHEKDVTVTAPNVVWFYENGELKYTSDISEPTAFTVQGREVMFSDGYDVYTPLGFHRNGHVFQGTLYGPTELEVQDSTYLFTGRVVFAESGNLLYGVVDEDAVFSVQGTDYPVPAGDDVTLYEDGTVKEVGLPAGEVRFRAGERIISFISVPTVSSRVTFHPNGNVMFGCLGEDTVFTVDGKEITVKTGTLTRFHEDGTLYREE